MERLQPGLMAATLERDAQGNLIRKAGIMAIVVASGEVRPGETDRLALDVGYRYRAAIDAFSRDIDEDTGFDPGTTTYETHAVQASLVWDMRP